LNAPLWLVLPDQSQKPLGTVTMQSVYLETSVIGYLASRPTSDIHFVSNQLITLNWWNNHRSKFNLFVSQSVLDECASGDGSAARERLDLIAEIPSLQTSNNTFSFAEDIMNRASLPRKAAVDALHIAIAAESGIDFLLTWNCKHIANPSLRHKISEAIEARNLRAPVICTPMELLYAG
jgi:hypothetical protein